MILPKKIEALINRRAKLASDLNSSDYELSLWLEKHSVEVEECDCRGGCEMYVNPSASAKRVKQAILDK